MESKGYILSDPLIGTRVLPKPIRVLTWSRVFYPQYGRGSTRSDKLGEEGREKEERENGNKECEGKKEGKEKKGCEGVKRKGEVETERRQKN